MNYINLIDTFDREIEVLEINDYSMIYAIDQKNEVMDLCSIGRYDFEEEIDEKLLTLDYARLYESFQSYKQHEDYFYCVNVLQDYRLRLRRISKLTWSQEGEIHLQALGEIINFFILNDQYLLIVDEVENSEAYRAQYHIESEENYINLVYLYDCYAQVRYPVTDSRLHGDIELLKLEAAGDHLILGMHYPEGAVNSGLYRIQMQEMIDAVVDKKPLFLQVVAEGREGCSVSWAECDEDIRAYRVTGENQEDLYRYDAETKTAAWIHGVSFEDHETLIYDPWTLDVYMTRMDEASDQVWIDCLNDPTKSFCMDHAEETFSGIRRGDIYLTTFYKEVKVKEYEFHENVGIYHLTDQFSESYEGRFAAWKDKIILLRTFLAL